MGSGGSKKHESFTVAPASGTATVELSAETSAVPPAVAQWLDPIVTAAVADGPPGDVFVAVCDAVAVANTNLSGLVAQGTASAEDVDAASDVIKAATTGYLGSLSTTDLQLLAAGSGFAHPHLVGLGGGATHPLVHWLDPAYPPDAPTKAKIQAKADERYAQLAAGETVGGLTLADLHALETAAGLPAPATAAATWTASAADIIALQTAVMEQTVAYTGITAVPERATVLAALIDAENRLATAECADLNAQLPLAAAAATAQVTKLVNGATYLSRDLVAPALDAGLADGRLSATEAKFLSPRELVAVLRQTTPADERAALVAAAADRADHLAGALAHRAHLVDAYKSEYQPLNLPALTAPGAHAALTTFTTAAHATFGPAMHATDCWAPSAALDSAERKALWVNSWGAPAGITKAFRAWAKEQPLASLRDVASHMGLDDAASASRAQVQNYIAAHWDTAHDTTAIQAAVSAAKNKPLKSKPTAAPSPAGVPDNVVKLATAAPSAAPDSFGSRHAALVAALKHHAASHTGLPARPAQADVTNWSFTPAAASTALGGAHTKSLHTAPDGSTWMFKPDKTAKGARAHAETAASEILHAVGLPSVPVRVATIGGLTGAIQPLVAGAAPLSAQPSSWSQADVDAIVRLHVGAWAIGDHDGHASNVLRTAAGGLVPCDQGQAFKHFGRDKLSTDYHPNASYGAASPVFHQAYAAAQAGGLGAGVKIRPEAALPVIAAFERLSDAQYRALLHNTAHEGAKHNVHWVPEMRERAAKRHNVKPADVTQVQIAEEFLEYAVARKKGLRTAFVRFFATEGFAGSAKLAQVA